MEKSRKKRWPKAKKTGAVTKDQVRQMIASNTQKEWNKKYILNNIGVPGSSQYVNETGVITSLTTVTQGTTNQTRVGNYARLRKIWGRVTGYMDSNDVQNSIRMILFQWTDAAVPTASDILVSATAYHTCYYNLNNIENGKLKILIDSRKVGSYQGNGPVHWAIDLKVDSPLQWNSTGSAAPIVNALYVYFVSDSSLATHPYIQSSWCVSIDNE